MFAMKKDQTVRGTVACANGERRDRVTAYFPMELGSRLRSACSSRRITLSEALERSVAEWLSGDGK
jgi:hypothetical protein